MFNLLADKNYDNGVIVAKNAYQYDDVYSVKDSTDFAGTIIDVAKNGNFIVHVDDPGDGLLVLTPPFSYVTEPSRFAAEDQFYNATGSIMRAYELVKDDEFAASAECFDTTPSKGQTVTVTATVTVFCYPDHFYYLYCLCCSVSSGCTSDSFYSYC